MSDTINFSNLLHHAGTFVKHQQEKEALRGERFNIFSVLRMESKENATHSAFLSEMLNPHGTHQKGDLFLQLFLHQIQHTGFDASSAKVIPEWSIGPRNDKDKTGGRIDIFLYDKNDNCISIENKIYAVDQFAQVERYYKYRQEKNAVYYLTLYGSEPSPESKGELVSGQDFFNISYHSTILEWLQVCMKEATEVPMLRETIKQYILLIKKLTGIMDNKSNEELNNLILGNYENAQYIFQHFKAAKQKFNEEIRQEVAKRLRSLLDANIFSVEPGPDTSNIYSPIWMRLKAYPDTSLAFGVETFSGEGPLNGKMFVGICNYDRKDTGFGILEKNKSEYGGYWFNTNEFQELNGYSINLGNGKTIQHLYSSPSFREQFIGYLAEEVHNYLRSQYDALNSYLSGR